MDLAFSHFSVKKNSSIQCRTINGMGKSLFIVDIFQITIVLSYINSRCTAMYLGKVYLLYLCRELSSCGVGVLSNFFISVISSSTVGFFLFLNHAVIVAHDHKCAS